MYVFERLSVSFLVLWFNSKYKKILDPLNTGLNWTYVRHLEDILDVFWTSYVRSIYVLVQSNFQNCSNNENTMFWSELSMRNPNSFSKDLLKVYKFDTRDCSSYTLLLTLNMFHAFRKEISNGGVFRILSNINVGTALRKWWRSKSR